MQQNPQNPNWRRYLIGGGGIVILMILSCCCLSAAGAGWWYYTQSQDVVECPECPVVEAPPAETPEAESTPEVEAPTDPTGSGSLTLEGVEVTSGDGDICNLYVSTGKGKSGNIVAEVFKGERLVIDAWQIDPHGDGPWIQYWDGPIHVEVQILDGAACISDQPEVALTHRQAVCPACKEVSN